MASSDCRPVVAAGSSTNGCGDLPRRFEGRIVLINGAIADEWGRLVARHEARGRPVHALDGLIAATAQVHALTLVTRNTMDVQVSVKSVATPWE